MSEKMKLHLDEIAERLGCAESTARGRLAQVGIQGFHEGEKRSRKLYLVDETFFEKKKDTVKDLLEKGYVMARDIGKRNGCSSVNVLTKLKNAGIPPDYQENGKMYLWIDRPELDMAVKIRRPHILDRNPGGPEIVCSEAPNRGYVKVIKGQGMDDLVQEREKKKWVGRKGRLVVEGHVVAEGIIETVSMCGVFLKGSLIRGNLDELELC